MALTREAGREEDSLFIDSFLSQGEIDEVHKMLEKEGDLFSEESIESSICTSTQMGDYKKKKSSLPFSPIRKVDAASPDNVTSSLKLTNRFEALLGQEEVINCLNKVGSIYQGTDTSTNILVDRYRIRGSGPWDTRGSGGTWPLDDTIKLTGRQKMGMQGSGGETPCADGPCVKNTADPIVDATGGALDGQVSNPDVVIGGEDGMQGTGPAAAGPDFAANPDEGSETRTTDDKDNTNKVKHNKDGNDVDGGDEPIGLKGKGIGNSGQEGGALDAREVVNKLDLVNALLVKLDVKSDKLADTVKELQVSLEYSQTEIDTLKGENGLLKLRLKELEVEEHRTTYQQKRIEERIDRVDTAGRKKNLILEGVPETEGGKEDTFKTVWKVLDHLNMDRPIDVDSCFRTGSFGKGRSRPITVTFVKQADRDLVYSRRAELRRTQEHKQVWINEDLGPASKKAMNMIRLIARQAQAEGVDHRTGKYAIFIDRRKFDESNLDELPHPLHPASLKQVQVDEDTIAYQSENAPLSNFYPAWINNGTHRFTCLEQAYQFLRAKTLNRPLAAARIYLLRDPVAMKRMGDELGTTDLWEKKKIDVMYKLLKMKFEQNDHLKDILLRTGVCELVEATPDRVWGCGATLSSSLLKRHAWPGENRQGRILMTVRDEMRASQATKTPGQQTG